MSRTVVVFEKRLRTVNLDSFLTIREWLIHETRPPPVVAVVFVLLFIICPIVMAYSIDKL